MHPVTAAALIAVALFSVRPVAQSQALPDFSGTWNIDRERSESPHQGETFTPTTYVVTQTATEVTIETRRGSARDTVEYPIGPSTSPPPPAAAAPDAKRATRAYWSGRSLVTEGLRTIQGQTVSLRETRTLNAAGTEMTLQTLLVVQHGYTLKGAQNYGTATDIYRRVTPEPR